MDLMNSMGVYGLYDYDITTIKRLRESYKVCNLKAIRRSGIECFDTKKKGLGEPKMDNNIVRAKTQIKEYALCNDWDYFCTFTISDSNFDRFDIKEYYKAFSRFVQNYNRYCSLGEKVKYVLIPEKHKDGAWHLHGFIKGIRQQDLFINDNGYISWQQYADNFGFMSFSPIKDINKTANYAMKYVTKDRAKNVQEYGAHIFYASKGLNKAQLIFKGKAEMLVDWDYVTPDEFCKVSWFDNIKELGKSIVLEKEIE